MQHNFLKLNSDKTEFLFIGSKSTLSKIKNPTLTIDSTTVSPSPQARNLGVIFDSTLSLEPHIGHIVKTSFFHLCNIAKIRPSLTHPAAKRLIHTFISSRLDYCNSFLFGISLSSIKRLQLVQNAAARLITHTKSWHHITPVLTDLLSPYQPTRSLRSTSAGLLSTPNTNLRSFGGALEQPWRGTGSCGTPSPKRSLTPTPSQPFSHVLKPTSSPLHIPSPPPPSPITLSSFLFVFSCFVRFCMSAFGT
ncbi:uncharacterized protein LOC118320408 [Scophthalmus maximus]|uniref:uncharacterized protein LOC118320408 n=1 Tax=Scophthalmus maximus TaxID=52904 RepID=UPI001FA831A1|nr:uncharacterized protein LOC118320408 [Scophthalmus maximus]